MRVIAHACGTISVAYQGGPGANGERAIAPHLGGDAQPVSVRSFPALVAAVVDGTVDYGVVPIWNSTIGAVRDACAALERMDESVEQVVHVTVAVRHALLALPGASRDALRAVGSHPAALDQCRQFLAGHPRWIAVSAWDTAGAAAELARFATPATAADDQTAGNATPWYAAVPGARREQLAVIANADVAHVHGLVVLAHDIQDDPDNRTRFAVIRAREGAWRW